jgi:hypothetical protein
MEKVTISDTFYRATETDVSAPHLPGMSVVAFQTALQREPTLLTVYGVRAYWNDRGRLAEGRLQQFANVESALRSARKAALRSPAVRVFRVRGNVEADYWEDPITVAKFGERADELSAPRTSV